MKIELTKNGYAALCAKIQDAQYAACEGILNPRRSREVLLQIRNELLQLNRLLKDSCVLVADAGETEPPRAA